MELGSARCCLVKQLPRFSWNTRAFGGENFHQLPHDVTSWNLMTGHQRLMQLPASIRKYPANQTSWRVNCTSVDLEETSSLESENKPSAEESSEESPEELLSKPKLSEANQQNRFLKRQLHVKEEALVDFKNELADVELEIQALVKLAEEIAKSAIPEGTRKINGKYIQSHLLSRLEAVLEKLKEQIKDVGVAQSKEVPLFWYGVAENDHNGCIGYTRAKSVQVMGTFDGWSQGEYLSPEYTGSYTKFSTTLLLRPGRYEIKFLVDGEWQLSPEFPTVGEGLTKNNLLVVE
uniref:AMP-activated protein kinase glycogen-binding domain-containing protein n=1 Tax=Ficus carica TaxID=3494 RepID=A0AA87YNS8_FICCA|nr:hypothetical protein TIFTF001_048600 [Ficus carica]GMN19379.1 hypothetical protein TIFTF001_048605 [Ficus carica]